MSGQSKRARPPVFLPSARNDGTGAGAGSPLRPTTDDSKLEAAEALEGHGREAGQRPPVVNLRTASPETIRDAANQQSGRAQLVDLSTRVPGYVMDQLRVRAAPRGAPSIRRQVLDALIAQGIRVEPVDLEEDRRRRR